MQKNYDLRPVWHEMLSIYDIFRNICKKHDLRHWVVYGTLIGAVRHKGFIPWDDDFDVAMPRPDYEKFQTIVQAELPANMEWASMRVDSTYNLAFGKVFSKDENAVSSISKASNLSLAQGIFIDVFPFDGFPSTTFGATIWFSIRAMLRRTAKLTLMEKYFSLWSYDKSRFICNSNSAWPFRSRSAMIKRREWVEKLEDVPFEDTVVTIPSAYDPYLRCEFGDYMQLPPEEERVPTHQVIRK